MARIEFGKGAKAKAAGTSFGGVKIPWKGIILFVLIGTSWYYIYKQYSGLQPRPLSQERGRRAGGPPREGRPPDVAGAVRNGLANSMRRLGNGNQQRNQWMAAVGLTDDQKAKVESIQKETTDTAGRMKRYNDEVLTPDQRKKFEEYRAEQRNRANRNRADGNTTGTQGGNNRGNNRGGNRPDRARDGQTTAPRPNR